MFKLLVGLGNPGPEYAETRHNAGFWWLEAVARELGIGLHPERGYFGVAGRGTLNGQTLWLLQPMTYMNRSGQAVAALARFFKIQAHEILVAHDELDLPPGELKLKQGGGHAGHNGLRDIHAQLGSSDYWRLRIGVGHPGIKAEVANWVLKKPAPDQQQALEQALQRSLSGLPDLLAGRMAKATATLHTSKPPRPKPPRPLTPPPGTA